MSTKVSNWDEDECATFQRDELHALEAIFADDLVNLRKSDGKHGWRPLEVLITLLPMVSMSDQNEAHVKVDLYVRCGKKYPNVIPDEIALRNTKGLSSAACLELKTQLYQLAKTLRGEVMIYQMTDNVKQFLHKHNNPIPGSFYDEMLSNKVKQEKIRLEEMQKMKQVHKLKEEEQSKLLEEALQKKKQALMEESRFRRESIKFDEDEEIIRMTNVNAECDINHGTTIIHFKINGIVRKIQKCQCLLHHDQSHLIDYFAIDPENGQIYVINEWIFDGQVSSQQKSFIYQVEKFFNSKAINLKNSNLISYLSMKTFIETERITVYVLREHIHDIPAYSLLMSEGNQMNMNLLRSFCKDILLALCHLHSHKCVHQDLKSFNVFFDLNSHHFKLTGYYIEKQMNELFSQAKRINKNAEINDSNIYEKSREDSFLLGQLILQIISCEKSSPIKSLAKISKDSHLDKDLFDFLEKCLESDINARWSAKDLLEHTFIVNKNKPIQKDLNINNRSKSKVTRDERINVVKESKIKLNPILPTTSSISRFSNEFEVLSELGKGGFGCVYKVRNLLDGGVYALKKIPINPSNLSLNKKMNREVTLQTRLYHENVVRYFSSWVESAENGSESSKTDTLTDTSPETIKSSNSLINNGKVSDDNSDEDEVEEDIFRTSFLLPLRHSSGFSDENYVVFDRSHTPEESETTNTTSKDSKKVSNEERKVVIPRQYMYIQMELCDCGTLKDAIENGLYNDNKRKRRLFREIVEGLVHIHEQGMIHRDLKPGNIFLDYNDSVKIGDFGLATTELVLHKGENQELLQELKNALASETPGKGYKVTGIVGTPLYIAPELTEIADANTNKIIYTQKVDIYSLGIILFEMSYPFQTSMERTKVIINLRKPDIVKPQDVEDHLTQMEIDLIQRLLQHDSSLRPSSSELLNSEYLPGPEMEEREELNIIKRTVLNSRTKTHKYMLNLLFQKESKEVEDIVYDHSGEQSASSLSAKKSPFSIKLRVFNYVYNSLQKVMTRHCALSLPIPLLIHKHSTSKYNTDDLFLAMDQHGILVSLPYDLRLPFARYVARNKISNIRRYSIEKVYRQIRFKGCHPREVWECAFDIVTPKPINSSHLMPDVETLCVLNEVVNEFPMLQGVGLTLKINHIKLLKSILIYCDISEDRHDTVLKFMSESWSNSARSHSVDTSLAANQLNKSFIKKKLISERILTDENRMNTLLQLLECEQDNVKKLMSNIKTHMRRKGVEQQNALELAKKSLKEIENVINHAERISQFKFSLKISPGFVLTGTNFDLYSDIFFQLEREIKSRKQTSGASIISKIAIGGRYDQLLLKYDVNHIEHSENFKCKHLHLGAVGISFELEKIVKCVLEEENATNLIFGDRIDVVLCSLSGDSSEFVAKEFCSITKELSSVGVKVFCFPEDLPKNIEDLHSFCFDNAVRYAIVLKDSSDGYYYQANAKLIAYEKERFIDKKVGTISELVDHLIKAFNVSKSDSVSALQSEQNNLSKSDSSKGQFMTSSESSQAFSTLASNIRVTFITSEKLQPASKRRHEGTIISLLASTLNFMNSNNIIEVITVDLPFKVIKTIVGEIEFEDEVLEPKNVFEKSKLSVMDKHQRYRQHIGDVMDTVFSFKMNKKSSPLIVLITIVDNMRFKILF